MIAKAGAVSGEAIRGYIRRLRQERDISQPKLASAIDMALRTYKDWETGNTKSLDAAYFLRIMRELLGDMLLLMGYNPSDLATGPINEESEEVRAMIAAATPEDVARVRRVLGLDAIGRQMVDTFLDASERRTH